MTEPAAPAADAAAGQLSEVLSESWRVALGRPPAGADSDFFASGGDSLLVVRIVSQLRRAGITAGPADILRGRTFAGMLNRLRESNPYPAAAPPGDRPVPPRRPDPPAAGPVPLLPAQLRWIGSGFADPDHFVREWVFKVPTMTPDGRAVDAERIESALRALTDRHETLRTRYDLAAPGGPAAEVLPRAPDGLVDIVDTGDGDVPGVLSQGMTRHSLAGGRVIRSRWLPLQRLLQLTVHNLTLDGWSVTMLADQLEDLLTGRDAGPPASQPRDWAADLAGWSASAQAAGDAARWADLGWDRVRPVPTGKTGPGLLPSKASRSATLDPAGTGALRAAARELDQPVDLLVLAAAGSAIADHFGLPAVSVDTYHHGRDGIPGGHDVTGTFGYLQCTYPVVVPAGAGRPWPERAAYLGRVPAGRFGFDALRFAGHPELAGLPGSDIRLVFRSNMNEMNAREGRWLRPAPISGVDRRSPRQREPHLLMLYGDLVAGRLVFTVTYSTDHFGAGTGRALAEATVRSLAGAGRAGLPTSRGVPA